IDAWMQHPSAEFLADPVFDSLRRWAHGRLAGGEVPVAATVAAMDEAGVRTGMLCAWWGPRGPLISNDAVAVMVGSHPDRFAGGARRGPGAAGGRLPARPGGPGPGRRDDGVVPARERRTGLRPGASARARCGRRPASRRSAGHQRVRSTGMTERTTPDDITAAVLASFARCPDERLGTVMRSLTAHLHAFVQEVGLTEEGGRGAIGVLTATGHITTGTRQEWILWSDALGVSMLVDALANRDLAGRATESTVQGPFYVPGSPLRPYGDRLDEMPAGEPLWVHGTVRSLDGRPLAGAELDVWQNGDNELYARQHPPPPPPPLPPP